MTNYEANRRAKMAADPEYAARRLAQRRAGNLVDRERNAPARDAARKALGLTYSTGKPCSRGHLAERYTANQTCVECSKADRSVAEEKRKKRRDSDPEYGARRRAQRAAMNRGYRKRNRDKKNAEWSKWRADKIQRTPKWADLTKIRAIYNASTRISRMTGIQHHVDHIIPLKGKLVSGLHIAENLRVIQAQPNLSKGSKYEP